MEHDIPFGNSNRENGPTFLDFPLFLGIFPDIKWNGLHTKEVILSIPTYGAPLVSKLFVNVMFNVVVTYPIKCSCDSINQSLLFFTLISFYGSWCNIFYLDIILLPWCDILYLDIILLPWCDIFYLDIILLSFQFTAVMRHFLPWYHFTAVMQHFLPWYLFTAVMQHFLPWYHFAAVMRHFLPWSPFAAVM